MKRILVIRNDPLQNDGVTSYIKKWIKSSKHRVSSINLYERSFPPEELIRYIRESDMIILQFQVEKAAYQNLKRILTNLPENLFVNKSIFTFLIGGTHAHLAVIDCFLTPILKRLGCDEKGIYLVDLSSNMKSEKKRASFERGLERLIASINYSQQQSC
ncbi:hypothetical protein ACFFHM_19850 [Halalkalibacter kiskunsagensis]|uniref:Uncharacterized protein n=1 Tax=Halalkalibacter kiskunsagensis TaxID=1548599 RepID=A0ABV6KH79_9BACI